MTRYYAGIGSRDTPTEIRELMTGVASRLEKRGFHLRSGGAEGADGAFQDGVSSTANRTLYVPWPKFNGLADDLVILAPLMSNWEDAMLIAEEYHPAWEKCSFGARKLLARNGYQILGDDLHTPVEFVICWTKSDKNEGGTGQALRIARDLPTPPPIYNLRHVDTLAKFRSGWLPA